MDNRLIEAHHAIDQAREALQRGERGEARRFAEHAASLAPQFEDPWLILAAVASPQTSVNYIKKALEINPNSPQAHKAMQWAMKRLQASPQAEIRPNNGRQSEGPKRGGRNKTKRRSPIYPILIFVLGCLVLVFAAWSASTTPVLASILNFTTPPQKIEQVQHPQLWARAEIAKPTRTPIAPPENLVAVEPTITPFIQPQVVELPSSSDEVVITEPTTVEPAAPEVTETPGTMYAEIIVDTPTPEYAVPTDAPYVSAPSVPQAASVSSADGVHWIDVNLTQQRVYAYAGDTIVNSFLASTGTWQTPTVTGKYKIWIKLRATDMSGPGYYLPDVPYTMYFYKGYGIHGTYWHNNFGTPMSHGCVNLSIPDAAWLYDFAYVGTTVNVHY